MHFYNNAPVVLDRKYIRTLIRQALREDGAYRDVTTTVFVPKKRRATGVIVAKATGVIAGLDAACAVFRELDRSFAVTRLVSDGDAVRGGQVIMRFEGRARAILSGERTALNILQHCSGIAASVAQYEKLLTGTKTRILDTRKTIPGLRLLEKYSVQMGGGLNHRYNLSDMVLVKDNHLVLSAETLEREIAVIRRKYPKHLIEVEAHSLAFVRTAVQLPIDMIMLDNMNIATMKKAVRIIRASARPIRIEASGNVSVKTVRAIARCGVDYISVGRVTHSPQALDLSLQLKS